MRNKYLLFIFTFILTSFYYSTIYSQTASNKITINSVVKDNNGNPIPNILILGDEGKIFTKTDNQGKFLITVPIGSNLIINADGFETLTILESEISDEINLEQQLFLTGESDSIQIAYDKIARKETVNFIDFINPEESILFDSEQNIYQFLTGRYASTSNILNLRGLGDALVVIDGVQRDLSTITRDEIEQITILRDVNATALYGTRGANGVIQITTKKGIPFQRKINLSLESGISEAIVLPKYLGSGEYMELYNEARVNDGLDPLYTEQQVSNYKSGTNPYRYPNVDYYSSEFLKSSKPFNRLGFEFSGGNKITQYFTNFGWYNSGNIYNLGDNSNSNQNRFHMRANVQMKVNDYIKANIDGFVLFDIYKQPNGNFWSYSSIMHPNYFSQLLPVNMIEGNEDILETSKIIQGKYILGGSQQYQDNIYGNMIFGGYNQNTLRTVSFTSGVDFDLRKILDGLEFKTLVNIDIFNSFSQSVNNSYAVYQPVWSEIDGQEKITSLTKIGDDRSSGTLNLGTADYYRSTGFQGAFDYSKNFDDLHSVKSTLLGYYSRTKTNFSIYDNKPAHIGFRVGYDYAKKYFIDFSSNIVYSVKLPEGNRSAFSPTIGLSWILTEEEWMDTNFMNYLKFKVSGGILNSDLNMGYYTYQSLLEGTGFYSYGDGQRRNMSLRVNRESNPDLTFEKIKNVNVGIETVMFDKSLTFNTNLFYMENSGQVIQRVIYPNFFSSYIPFENYNSDTYSGVELGINWFKKIKEFSINLNGNLLFASSKIKTRDEVWQEEYLYWEGNPVSSVFGLEALGLFRDQNEINNSPVQSFGDIKPGDIKYKDQNNDGIIDNNDNIYLGHWNENISFGFNFNFAYKNFSLLAGIHGINGGKAIYSGDYFWFDAQDKYSELALDRWTPETADVARYPRLTSGNSANNYRGSSFWIYDRSYLNLDRVQLTYRFPSSLGSRLNVKDMIIYLRGSNLFMLAEDADMRQIRVGQEPDYRNYSLGLKVIF